MKLLLPLTLIVFWNVENFFWPEADSKNASELSFTPGGSRHWTRKRFWSKADGIAKTLLLIADNFGEFPDVVALAEVENEHCLKAITGSETLRKAGYRIIHYDSSDPRGIDCALLYKEGFKPVKTDTLHFERTRDILIADFDSLLVEVVHLPSQISGKEEKRHHIISRAHAYANNNSGNGAKAVIIGDFNESGAGMDSLMLPLRELIDSTSPGTIRFQGRWETIDRCFVSDSLCARLEVFAPRLLLEEDKKYGGAKPRRTFLGPRYNAGLSDHLPIVVVLD